MPYMDIPVALREMHRVLRVGGEIRLKLHPLSFTLAELKTEVRTGSMTTRLKNLVYRSYVLANGAALHAGGFTFRFPLARRRCESFQTQAGMLRALRAAGFAEVDVSCWDDRALWPRAGNCRASARRSS
jgi:ubiquinone/menaquinone biosynthesis C-methylase UbiE